jgi:hypothetical protein
MNIDVLLPFHRNDGLVQDAIDSVLKNQGCRVILIDDRRKFERTRVKIPNNNRIELIETTGKIGYGKALELGSKLIQNDFIALMNSDDLVSPDKFKKQMNSLENKLISITGMNKTNLRGQTKTSILGPKEINVYDPIFLMFGAYGANATWMMRKEWFEQNFFFDSKDCLDWRIAMRNFKCEEIAYVKENLYIYRQHLNQVTKNRVSENSCDEVITEWLALCNRYGLKIANNQIFTFLAAPWLNKKSLKLSDLGTLFEDLKIITNKQISSEVRQLLNEILSRRVILQNLKNFPNLDLSVLRNIVKRRDLSSMGKDFLFR